MGCARNISDRYVLVRGLTVWSLALMMAMPVGMNLPADSSAASTRAGAYTPWWDYAWTDRMPVSIDNTDNPATMYAFQIMLNVTYRSEMRSDFSDLRFVYYNSSSSQNSEMPYWTDTNATGQWARIWIKAEYVQGGTVSTVYMYYGNPSAASKSDPDSVFDFFDDFNGGAIDTNKWTVDDPTGWSVAAGELKGTSNTGCLRSKTTVANGMIIETRTRGVSYAGNSHAPITAWASTSDTIGFYWGYVNGAWAFYSFYADGPPAVNYLWKNADAKTIFQIVMKKDNTNDLVKRDYDSYDFVDSWTLTHPGLSKTISGDEYIRLGRRSDNSYQGQAYEAYWDWVRLRKLATVDPNCTFGDQELPFKFLSMTYSPSRMNGGETVFFNATFNNPSPNAVKIQLAAKESDNFNDTTDHFYQEEVTLSPLVDTTFPFTWTAVGGPHTIWLAVYGYPFASAKIKVNRDPVIAPLKDQVLWQDRDFLLQVNASDQDGDSLSWSIDDPFFNISPVSNRSAEISVLPTNDDVGIYRANITARDPMNRTDTRRINFTVNNVNDPPGLAKIPSLSATQYKELRYQANAADVDIKWGDMLTFSDNTDLFEIDSKTGELFFTPVEDQVGKHNVKVTVADIAGASETCSFTITVANVNDPPALEMLPPQFALQSRLFQLKVVAADPDLKSDTTERLRFTDDCVLFNINNDTGLISFTPTNDQLGVWRSNITVTDKGGLSNTTRLTITVMNANDPPALEAIPPQTATEGVPYTYQLTATDPDLKWGLDNLTFSDDTELFNIDPKTGAIAFTPSGTQTGIKRVTITVKDEKGASASASFDITIVHVNHPPYDIAIRYPADGARLKEGDAMWLDGTARDSDKGDALDYSWSDNGEPVGTGRNISVRLSPGTHAIKLEVSDGSETASTEITVQVEKKETVTVSGGGIDWLPLAVAAAAVFAIVAVVAVLAAKRRKRQEEPEPSGMGRVESVPEGEGIALLSVPPAEAGPKGPGEEGAAGSEDAGAAGGEEARRVIGSTVDKLADYQEAHPEVALDFTSVMEKLDIARDMLGTGENVDALDFAKDAEAEANRMMAPAAPKKVVVKKRMAIR
jgi:hypothetical protein